MEWSGISLGSFSPTIGSVKAFAQEIGPETEKRILQIVVSSYAVLHGKCLVTSNWEEDRITEALYEEILVVWSCSSHSAKNWKPVHQFPVFPKKSVRGTAPSIDFVFSKGYETQLYFAFECKIVNHTNKTLTGNYVRLGMNRYVSEVYSAQMPRGGMIGYTFDRQISLIVQEINSEIMNRPPLTNKDFLINGTINLSGFSDLFVSNHIRNPSRTPFMIYHLFLTF